MDGEAERTIQILEAMLRACVIDFKGSWNDHLPLIEFAYNNSYHSSIQMAPYEAFNGRRCRSTVGWFEVGSKAEKQRSRFSVKVLWRSQSVEGATWEAEAAMKAKYPQLFLPIPFQL
ncbi:hypothetical protein MTR67_017601 [Solanum verrucosum]|uniref:Integrase catalytic domain-containing protein n=1 Tax=Solanum verrucosum TaxID=315347 RepID=A0AAF0TLM8_SOLVR|nr:hypothetical protein MTR67_017601 [Solanum verrucosum]